MPLAGIWPAIGCQLVSPNAVQVETMSSNTAKSFDPRRLNWRGSNPFQPEQENQHGNRIGGETEALQKQIRNGGPDRADEIRDSRCRRGRSSGRVRATDPADCTTPD